MKTLPLLIIALAMAGAATAQPTTLPDSYVAHGNKPGWTLNIQSKTLSFKADYALAPVHIALPARQLIHGGYSYTARVNGQRLSIAVLHRLCRDDAGSVFYPDKIIVADGLQLVEGCGGDPADLLQHARWVVRSIDGKEPAAPSPPTLIFETAGRVSGQAPCNSYSANYGLGEEGLRFGNVVSTKRTCAPALMELEGAMLGVLSDAVRYVLADDGSLTIETNDGRQLVAHKS